MPLGQQLRGHRTPQEASARAEQHGPVPPLDQPAIDQPVERIAIDDARDTAPVYRERLVEPEPEHQQLDRAGAFVEELDLAGWILAGRERRHVAPDGGRVPPSLAPERRHRPDADAEVIGAAPDRQVVLRAELALSLR